MKRELHLFAGIGGGILGGMLLGHRCVGAVELDPHCRKVLEARQRDGILPPLAPARRRALVLKFGLYGALRLQRLQDPDF